ncbi:hypothetical protein P175DRAFT_0298518 [Aspergillus ochraceoroseus IBT 24754]|uniref:Uncharacterized protein n=1 Tax=Aspergillus ochraceoroseus IBT 24754 TaxID=1392256 RepID=A0A2T5LSR7_9EURO|nr:uncharacterized protein P175DRAFT_0298518 [Aspergillus ochraceoroseus IBT 24754]PTU19332.1 hypothetical protein P175DRAFT_0298518 [Aspergillus ochraceoroseus IBT 24754]
MSSTVVPTSLVRSWTGPVSASAPGVVERRRVLDGCGAVVDGFDQDVRGGLDWGIVAAGPHEVMALLRATTLVPIAARTWVAELARSSIALGSRVTLVGAARTAVEARKRERKAVAFIFVWGPDSGWKCGV